MDFNSGVKSPRTHCVKAFATGYYEATVGDISDPEIVLRRGVSLDQFKR